MQSMKSTRKAWIIKKYKLLKENIRKKTMQRNNYINIQVYIPQRTEKQKDTSAIIVKHNQPTETNARK